MTQIIDAHALMIFLEKETGYEKVEQHFIAAIEKDSPILMTSVNYGEVYYIVLRECGEEKVRSIEKIIKALPIDIVDVDIQLAREAGRFKATRKMSYADCFAAALAKLHKGEVITGDKEFRAVENEVKVFWIN
jgi:predicted nucleic acid-binding protein